MGLRSKLRDQRGFTIVEVVVSATLLVVGVLGTMALVDSSNAETQLTGGRDGATNLAREVVEGARSIGYDQLQQATVVGRLQALPGLASTSGTSWTVQRRGIVYTLTATLCSVDDPKDGYGAHPGVGAYCADSSTTGSADAQPEDFKRIAVVASWTRRGGTQRVRQTAVINSPASKGPQLSALVATSPVSPDPAAPKITSSGVSTVAFKATAPPGVQSMTYSVDGTEKGNATVAANGTDWTFSLGIAGLSDGSYDISVRATDARGVTGPAFTIPLRLIRGTPAAPSGPVGGPNSVYVGGTLRPVVELEWQANPERNVIGYRVYNSSNALVCPGGAQTLSLKPSCIDMANTGGSYRIVALYRNASDVVTEGPAASIATTTTVNRRLYFKKTTPSSGTNCAAATTRQDMEEGYAGLNPKSTFAGSSSATRTLNLCSPPFAAGDALRPGPAETTTYMDNTSNPTDCVVTSRLYRNGTATPLTGALNTTVPKKSAILTLTGSLGNVPAVTFAAGDRLNLVLSWAANAGCALTSLHYGDTTYRSSLVVPSNQVAPPSPPTGLTATTLADGTTQLSWALPAAGNPVAFFRIYRDGIDYTNRLDTTGLGTDTTYVDEPGGSTHTYYVTAVSDKLSESPMVGPVTK